MITEFATTARALDDGARQEDRVADLRVGRDDGAVGNDAVGHDRRCIDVGHARESRRQVCNGARAVQQVEVRPQIQRRIARVEPVVVGRHGEETAVGDDLGERDALDRHLLRGGDALQAPTAPARMCQR